MDLQGQVLAAVVDRRAECSCQILHEAQDVHGVGDRADVHAKDIAAGGGDFDTIGPGGGKTLGGFLPSLVELAQGAAGQGLHTLYVSPLKALSTDVGRNLAAPVQEMGLAIRHEVRTGDTPQNRRVRQRRDPPDILMTTPESLATPMLVRVGWMDAATVNVALGRFFSLKTPQRLEIGPWSHGGGEHIDQFLPDSTATVPSSAEPQRLPARRRSGGLPVRPTTWQARAWRRGGGVRTC